MTHRFPYSFPTTYGRSMKREIKGSNVHILKERFKFAITPLPNTARLLRIKQTLLEIEHQVVAGKLFPQHWPEL